METYHSTIDKESWLVLSTSTDVSAICSRKVLPEQARA